MSTPTTKKAASGRKASQGSKSFQTPTQTSSTRDAVVGNSSSRDALIRKDSSHYHTRSVSRSGLTSLNRVAATSSAAKTAAWITDDVPVKDSCVPVDTDDVPVQDGYVPSIKSRHTDEFPVEDVRNRVTSSSPDVREDDSSTKNRREDSSSSREEDPSESYNFLAVDETPPTDRCMLRNCFEAAINERASDYEQMRERRRLRDMELDLLMGVLGAANQDEIISVPDIKEFTENRIASLGVSSVTYSTTDNSVEVITRGEIIHRESFSTNELPSSDETMVFNGKITPYTAAKNGTETFNFEKKHTPARLCAICQSPSVSKEFGARHKKENLKHLMSHAYSFKSVEDSGPLFETTFSVEADVIDSNYERRHNYLPTTADLHEAVNVIAKDDYIPFSRWMDDFEIIESGIRCIAGLSLPKLLKFYYCIVNSVYDVRGSTIRHIQMCRSNIPPLGDAVFNQETK